MKRFWIEVYGKASHLQGMSHAFFLSTEEGGEYAKMTKRYKAIAEYCKRRLL